MVTRDGIWLGVRLAARVARSRSAHRRHRARGEPARDPRAGEPLARRRSRISSTASNSPASACAITKTAATGFKPMSIACIASMSIGAPSSMRRRRARPMRRGAWRSSRPDSRTCAPNSSAPRRELARRARPHGNRHRAVGGPRAAARGARAGARAHARRARRGARGGAWPRSNAPANWRCRWSRAAPRMPP